MATVPLNQRVDLYGEDAVGVKTTSALWKKGTSEDELLYEFGTFFYDKYNILQRECPDAVHGVEEFLTEYEESNYSINNVWLGYSPKVIHRLITSLCHILFYIYIHLECKKMLKHQCLDILIIVLSRIEFCSVQAALDALQCMISIKHEILGQYLLTNNDQIDKILGDAVECIFCKQSLYYVLKSLEKKLRHEKDLILYETMELLKKFENTQNRRFHKMWMMQDNIITNYDNCISGDIDYTAVDEASDIIVPLGNFTSNNDICDPLQLLDAAVESVQTIDGKGETVPTKSCCTSSLETNEITNDHETTGDGTTIMGLIGSTIGYGDDVPPKKEKCLKYSNSVHVQGSTKNSNECVVIEKNNIVPELYEVAGYYGDVLLNDVTKGTDNVISCGGTKSSNNNNIASCILSDISIESSKNVQGSSADCNVIVNNVDGKINKPLCDVCNEVVIGTNDILPYGGTRIDSNSTALSELSVIPIETKFGGLIDSTTDSDNYEQDKGQQITQFYLNYNIDSMFIYDINKDKRNISRYKNMKKESNSKTYGIVDGALLNRKKSIKKLEEITNVTRITTAPQITT